MSGTSLSIALPPVGSFLVFGFSARKLILRYQTTFRRGLQVTGLPRVVGEEIGGFHQVSGNWFRRARLSDYSFFTITRIGATLWKRDRFEFFRKLPIPGAGTPNGDTAEQVSGRQGISSASEETLYVRYYRYSNGSGVCKSTCRARTGSKIILQVSSNDARF